MMKHSRLLSQILPLFILGGLLATPSATLATHERDPNRCVKYDPGEPKTLDYCIQFARKAHPTAETSSGGGTIEGTDIPKVTPIKNATIPEIGITAINFLLVVAGALSVIFLIVGGIRYIISSGSPDAIDRAKKTVLYAVVGIIVVLLSYTIVNILTGIK